MPIPEALYGLSFEDYVTLEGKNWSKIRAIRKSPMHYADGLLAPDEDSAARKFGRAAHTLILEPHRFDLDYVVYDGEGTRASKAYKAFAEAEEAGQGRTILKADEVEPVRTLAARVRANPALAPYLENSRFEVTLRWEDPTTGYLCKCRIDWLHTDADGRMVVIDPKTTGSTSAHFFGNIAAKQGYYGQLAHYGNGIAAVFGRPALRLGLLAIEAKRPHDSALFFLDSETLELGQDEVADCLLKIQECEAAGHWPGRFDTEQLLKLPRYVFGNEDEQMTVSITEDED